MKLNYIICLFLILEISCQNRITKKDQLLLQKVEVVLPNCIENAIQNRLDKYPNVKVLAVSFHLSVDSTKFIISDVNEIDFIMKNPSNYYTFRNNKCLLLYSGLEGYIKVKDSIIIPIEIEALLSQRQNEILNRMVEPFHVEYKYFNFDSCLSYMTHDTILFNTYLPFTVKISSVPFKIKEKSENDE